jgi:putative DNA methylase
LPHWDAPGQPVFVTFRLHGSLPSNRSFERRHISSGRAFLCLDRLLDCATAGPLYLRQPPIAEVVLNAIRDGEERLSRYELHAFAIMPNHVHLLVTLRIPLRDWLGPLKGFTGMQANRLLGRSGMPFWQEESFDRLVRNTREFERIRSYIETNPAHAALVSSPEDWPWSSATE